MYRMINTRIEDIIQAFKNSGDLESYNWLLSALHDRDVSDLDDYQRRFRAFWRMRCGDPYGTAFFDRLEHCKNGSGVDPVAIARELYAYPTRGGRQTLEFSFATKLAHMVDPHLPIYDAMISSFYFLPAASGSNNLEKRLAQCAQWLDFLKREYARILVAGLLDPAIGAFRRALPPVSAHTDEKVVDWLIWKFIDLARDDHLVALFRESQDIVLVAASGKAFEEERSHLALELTAGPVLASSLDFVEATGCWVLDAHQDEIVGSAEMRREEGALDGRGFGQQRCPFVDSALIGKQRGTLGKGEIEEAHAAQGARPEAFTEPGGETLGEPVHELLAVTRAFLATLLDLDDHRWGLSLSTTDCPISARSTFYISSHCRSSRARSG